MTILDLADAKELTDAMFRRAVLIGLGLGTTDPDHLVQLTEALVGVYLLGVEHGGQVAVEALQEAVDDWNQPVAEETKH